MAVTMPDTPPWMDPTGIFPTKEATDAQFQPIVEAANSLMGFYRPGSIHWDFRGYGGVGNGLWQGDGSPLTGNPLTVGSAVVRTHAFYASGTLPYRLKMVSVAECGAGGGTVTIAIIRISDSSTIDTLSVTHTASSETRQTDTSTAVDSATEYLLQVSLTATSTGGDDWIKLYALGIHEENYATAGDLP